ncbi:hypothetical protein LEP1GSC193_3754 [Leptospira alstonii serovar Pingchang str. 80-412]|uniref:Uncharacterized protein n=2 Tax=Leptospira alstonii TaxID=28452 RepID=M6CKZ4_9LEPT|nr:hypothetical protein LEP1GSC194_2265 [Leptospira alstonii serovar Sichuan str. 79601]EQA80705.1 hypothetical protein LEP1GSC193_3754 [Leptospira alstonii serovar Pingchang str. 80-412]
MAGGSKNSENSIIQVSLQGIDIILSINKALNPQSKFSSGIYQLSLGFLNPLDSMVLRGFFSSLR